MLLSEMRCSPSDRGDPIPSLACKPDGAICQNGNKAFEHWFHTGFVGANNSFPVTLEAGKPQTLMLKAPSRDQNLVITEFLPKYDFNLILVRFHSQTLDRYFSNVPVPIDVYNGTPNFPEYQAGVYWIKAGTGLEARVLSFVPNTLRLTARGRRTDVKPGDEAYTRAQEAFYRTELGARVPYVLGPDNSENPPLVFPGTQVQLTYTCPSVGDFYGIRLYWKTAPDSDPASFLIQDWTEQGPENSFLDRNMGPLPASEVFNNDMTVAGLPPFRGSMTPGAWGGYPWYGHEPWSHVLHRGTQMQLTIRNVGSDIVHLFPLVVGYLDMLPEPKDQFLAFPMNQGQVARNYQSIAPGDPSGYGPCQEIPGGHVIRQAQPGCPTGDGRRYFAPSQPQLYRGGQTE